MFDPTKYAPDVVALLLPDRICDLGPGHPNRPARSRLDILTPERITGRQPIRDLELARTCLAGLWLRHDFLDESHRISQEILTPTGSYWHAIMHRREGDFGNAKYWFRRVGRHPVFTALHDLATASPVTPAPRLSGSMWDPFAFVDWCESAISAREPIADWCRWVQAREWELLFDFCHASAVAS
jgi:hypothetical protein